MMKIEYADEPKSGEVERVRFEFGEICIGGGFAVSAKQISRAEDYNDEYVRARNYDVLKARLAELRNPKTLLSDGMVECAICQQSISIGCGYRNSDAGTVHDMESDCAANLAFVFDALEKAESQLATARQDAFAECHEIALDYAEASDVNPFARTACEFIAKAILYAQENPTPKPAQPTTPPLSQEATQGCECENCRDERKQRNYGFIYDAGRGEHISGCICHDCHLKRSAMIDLRF